MEASRGVSLFRKVATSGYECRLALGAPLGDHDLKAVARHRPGPYHPVVWTEPSPRRVRAFLDGTAVADSTRALLLEAGHLPV